MKAARPTNVHINLFPANAHTYLKTVRVTPEWQRFTLNVPEYGKDAPGVVRIGTPANTYGALYNLVFPRLDFEPDATVWIDDASSRLSLDTRFADDAHVWIAGNLNHDSTIYHPGDPITAKLTNAPGNNAPIGGLKVVTERGWFAVRPSGTENISKVYAESLVSEAHLKQIQQEATAILNSLN